MELFFFNSNLSDNEHYRIIKDFKLSFLYDQESLGASMLV